jgi:metallo-beta-lactamase class B
MPLGPWPATILAASLAWGYALPSTPPLDPIEVKGGIDKEVVRRIVRRHADEVKFCYEHALAANPTLAGRVVLNLTVAANGDVIDARVQDSTLGNAAVETCLAAVARNWEFPYPPPPGRVVISHPFVFKPNGATPTARGVEIEQLADGVLLHRSTDANGIPSNGLIAVTDGGLVLIDTAWTEAQTDVILRYGDSLFRHHPWIGAVVTHDHADRTGGLGALFRRGIPVGALDLTVARLEKRGVRGVTTLFAAGAGAFKDQRGFEAFYPGPGHAPDNIVVKVGRIVFGGCLVKSIDAPDLGFTGDSNVAAWPAAVRRVAERYGRTTIVPGHGPVDPTGSAYTHTLDLLARQPR